MMIFELEDTSKAESLFAGWEETLIYSCIERVMGKILVTDINVPKSACAYVGCFAFYAGEPDKELLEHKPDGFIIMVPQNEEWAHLIEKCLSNAKRISRYAIRKNTQFDVERLQNYVNQLPEGYELKEIDGDIYDRCIENPHHEGIW